MIEFTEIIKGNTKIMVFRGGLGAENPAGILDNAIGDYVGSSEINQFIELPGNNPWVRVVIENINDLDYIELVTETSDTLFSKYKLNSAVIGIVDKPWFCFDTNRKVLSDKYTKKIDNKKRCVVSFNFESENQLEEFMDKHCIVLYDIKPSSLGNIVLRCFDIK